jgi:hypothetical protein
VNAEGGFGVWRYAPTHNPNEMPAIIDQAAGGQRAAEL